MTEPGAHLRDEMLAVRDELAELGNGELAALERELSAALTRVKTERAMRKANRAGGGERV